MRYYKQKNKQTYFNLNTFKKDIVLCKARKL